MDFARSQLLKYGWEEGKGLGRNETGIKTHIKPKMKMDKTGIGHDVSKEYTNHWWDHIFNKTADSIQVTSTEDGVKIKRNSKHEKEVSKNLQTYSKKAMKYGNFLGKATLSDGLERENDGGQEEEEDGEVDKSSEVDKEYCLIPGNEDEVFNKCGGRTAHKGARHGLKLNGKLLRIQEQEQLLLDKLKTQSTNQNDCNKSQVDIEENSVVKLDRDETEHSRKRKKKKKTKQVDSDIDNEIKIADEKVNIKRKKQKPVEENNLDLQCNAVKEPDIVPSEKRKKKKVKDQEDSLFNEENHGFVNKIEIEIEKTASECDIYSNQDGSTTCHFVSKKKKKKKKMKKESE